MCVHMYVCLHACTGLLDGIFCEGVFVCSCTGDILYCVVRLLGYNSGLPADRVIGQGQEDGAER